MRRIVAYLTRTAKIQDLNIRVGNVPEFENKLELKINNDLVLLINDDLEKSKISSILELYKNRSKFAFVFHTNMKESKDTILEILDRSLVIGYKEGLHEEEGDEAKIYNNYLVPIIYNEKTTENFNKLWSVFEQEDELNKTLNILHQLASGKEIGDIDIKGTLVETNTEVREAFEALKDITNEKYEALFTCFKKTITNYAIDM